MVVTDIEECEFYHVMDRPDGGVWGGQWDLRPHVDEYLGHFDLKGKRVLELGTASGYLCFEMERRGADVVAYDIGPQQDWDIVPFAQYDYKSHSPEWRKYIEGFKKAFWYAHAAYGSKAKAVYGSVYDVPGEIGEVDVATFGSILLHLRDPFQALYSGTRLVKDTVIVSDLLPAQALRKSQRGFVANLRALIRERFSGNGDPHALGDVPYMEFLPNFRTLEHKEVWWLLSPLAVINFLGVLGFEETSITYHTQVLNGSEADLYTIVAHRTKGAPEAVACPSTSSTDKGTDS